LGVKKTGDPEVGEGARSGAGEPEVTPGFITIKDTKNPRYVVGGIKLCEAHAGITSFLFTFRRDTVQYLTAFLEN